MAIYSFDAQREQFVTINQVPDFRSEIEKQLTPIAIYDHGKPDIAYAERMAEEMINISAAWVTVFLKQPLGDSPETNIWNEDADSLYSAGKRMKAYMKPEPAQVELTRWGVDIPLRATIVFSRAGLMTDPQIGGRLLIPGDVIEAPYNLPSDKKFGSVPKRFRILNAPNDGYFMYRWLYVKAICELITGDEALQIRTDNNTPPK